MVIKKSPIEKELFDINVSISSTYVQIVKKVMQKNKLSTTNPALFATILQLVMTIDANLLKEIQHLTEQNNTEQPESPDSDIEIVD